jgi:hypothetical protein
VIAVHVRGAFLACKYALPRMNDGGSIIITSSVVGAMGAPGSVAYVTAKHAQVGLMRTVAKEAARRGIRVNTLHPGPIGNAFQLTIEEGIGKMAGGVDGTKLLDDMIPLHRHARPDEIARSALYLASDMASFVTAATLMADRPARVRVRAHSDWAKSGCALDSLSGACPFRKTGSHFSGTCAGLSLIAAKGTCGPCVRPMASSLPVGRSATSAPASDVWRSTPIFQVEPAAS